MALRAMSTCKVVLIALVLVLPSAGFRQARFKNSASALEGANDQHVKLFDCGRLCYSDASSEPCHFKKLSVLWTTFRAGVIGGVGRLFGRNGEATELNEQFVEHVREYFKGNSTKKKEEALWFCFNMCEPNEKLANGKGFCEAPELDKRFDDLADDATKLADSKDEPDVTTPDQLVEGEDLKHDEEDDDELLTEDEDPEHVSTSKVPADVEQQDEDIVDNDDGVEQEEEEVDLRDPKDFLGRVVIAISGSHVGKLMVVKKQKIGERGTFIANMGRYGYGHSLEVAMKDIEVDEEKTKELEAHMAELFADAYQTCQSFKRKTEKREHCCLFSPVGGCRTKVGHLGYGIIASCIKGCSNYQKTA